MDEIEKKLNYILGKDFSQNKNIIAVSCLQFGDTGKGKFVDMLASWADIIVRCTGGDNAGHTVICHGKEKVFHLIPSGIRFDKKKKINIIARGTVINPKKILEEIYLAKSEGISCEYLKISLDAQVIMPYHILLDRLSESVSGSGKIGTTGKGIGPCYADFTARRGIKMNDLLNPTIFRRKLLKNLDYYNNLFKSYPPAHHYSNIELEVFDHGFYGSSEAGFNLEALAQRYLAFGEKLKPFISNTDKFLRERVGKSNILLEGAQGYLLSVSNGTYPYVTSSDSSVAGMLKGAGLELTSIDCPLGIIKGFYMTRVGGGPFPTELGGKSSEKWCGSTIASRSYEKARYGGISINAPDEFLQGVAIRLAAVEYGATTGRPRRIGWLDLPLLRHSLSSGANQIVMTKLDVLSNIKKIKICFAYKYQGDDFVYGDKIIKYGDIIQEAIMDPDFLYHCKPLYEEFAGWSEDIRLVRHFSDLPQNLKYILQFIFSVIENAKLKIISVGPDAEESIFVGPEDVL